MARVNALARPPRSGRCQASAAGGSKFAVPLKHRAEGKPSDCRSFLPKGTRFAIARTPAGARHLLAGDHFYELPGGGAWPRRDTGTARARRPHVREQHDATALALEPA